MKRAAKSNKKAATATATATTTAATTTTTTTAATAMNNHPKEVPSKKGTRNKNTHLNSSPGWFKWGTCPAPTITMAVAVVSVVAVGVIMSQMLSVHFGVLHDTILQKPLTSDVGQDSSPSDAAVPLTDPLSEPSHPGDAATGAGDSPRRIVAVGDLHGDLSQALKTLKMARIMDENQNWAAGNAVFVQTGDVVDRGPDTIKLYKMLYDLKVQAAEHGGQVIQLLGNHEVMNMAEDLRYVTPEDFSSFGGRSKRREAFSADGWPGKYLRTLGVTTWVNGTVFFHGGANPSWAKLGIDGMNEQTHKGLIGRNAQQIHDVPIFGGSGPLWFRGYAQDSEKVICKQLDKALADMNAVRMVVGHTPQLDGTVLSRCNGKLHVIDVGISRVYGGNSAAIEIIGGDVYALYPGQDPLLITPTH
ncbi:hypothetical protein BASA60_000085 [Batrachochytrium salamandrivorans]|nr:hypothetical protein BASA60_000085 [Batrachochytrium salamandrivorans]